MGGEIVLSGNSWDNNASQLEVAQCFEQRGRWTGFNGTVPRLSIPRKSEKLSGLLLQRSWLMAATIKHGDRDEAKIRRKGSTSVSKTFPSRKLAIDWGINTESEMLRGQYICRDSARK